MLLSELDQCRVKKLAQGFNTAAQDSNPGTFSRESEALPVSHSVLTWSGLEVTGAGTVATLHYLKLSFSSVLPC